MLGVFCDHTLKPPSPGSVFTRVADNDATEMSACHHEHACLKDACRLHYEWARRRYTHQF
jgi:hypothetical protein